MRRSRFARDLTAQWPQGSHRRRMGDVGVPRDPFALTGSTLAGRYHIECQIGEGGFAIVYRAYQAVLDRFVALKVLKTPPGLDAAAQADFRERFASEARTIARLKHPYVVSVYDFGVDRMASGKLAPWMALEWLDGETLASDLDRRRGAGGRSTAEAVTLLWPVIDALAYAHRQGIVHRDVKPANMMLVPAEHGRVLRILDFGIAKIVRQEQADTTKRTGTSRTFAFSPDYAAPEQVTFSRTGPWTDVHALGLVLTEMLTDEAPFSTEGDGHLFEQVMAPKRPTPRRKAKRVGPLEKVIEKAVALSPRQRWQNAGELLRAIDSLRLAPKPRRRAVPESAGASKRPRPPKVPSISWAKPAIDRIVGTIGGTAVLLALGTLGWTLRADRPSLPLSAEFAFARPLVRPARAHPASHDRAVPWIVSIPPAPPASSASSTPEPPTERRSKSAVSTERTKEVTNPKATAANWGNPLANKATEKIRRASATARWVDPFDDKPAGVDESCRMTINSSPWSEVWLDGKNTTQHTPLVDYRLRCGHHWIEFKRADLRIDQIETLVVEPNRPLKRRYVLTGGE